MRIDNYNSIRVFLEDKLSGRDIIFGARSYTSPSREHTGKFKDIYYEKDCSCEKIRQIDNEEEFEGRIVIEAGEIKIHLEAGKRREYDKLDLVAFESKGKTIYYLASEYHRENGGGIFLRKID